ncbi:SRPBCC family protein [Micromonospora sp. NBC_01813]|uniref:SRPBCC family protein n=1 Tax=Micromonospora sp. NBC_01813 TaxID=2975988 RepID=UPI002DD846BC|nr:SRPBCC family protein [Micromonospora sp. NBC_01813]WSA12205.1 SRPBCC family protein [Micromonospora sp. NBC_01813]
MRTETFTDRFPVGASPRRVYDHLAEPTNHIGLSPLIVAVRDIERETDAAGRAVLRYVAVERFRIVGPLRYDNILQVRQTNTEPGRQLVVEVRSPARVSVRFVIEMEPFGMDSEATGTGSAVTITITLTMPTILRSYVVRTAKWVQLVRARTLAERMSG